MRNYPEKVLRDLLDRPWFTRSWVLQEVAGSRSAVVICGSRTVSWDCFTRWPFRTRWHNLYDTSPGVLNYHSDFTPSSGGTSLLHLLHDNREAIATGPRDQVFAVFGLLVNSSPYLGLMNYSLPVKDVCVRIAVENLSESRSLGLLSAAGIDPSNIKNTAFPPGYQIGDMQSQSLAWLWAGISLSLSILEDFMN